MIDKDSRSPKRLLGKSLKVKTTWSLIIIKWLWNIVSTIIYTGEVITNYSIPSTPLRSTIPYRILTICTLWFIQNNREYKNKTHPHGKISTSVQPYGTCRKKVKRSAIRKRNTPCLLQSKVSIAKLMSELHNKIKKEICRATFALILGNSISWNHFTLESKWGKGEGGHFCVNIYHLSFSN